MELPADLAIWLRKPSEKPFSVVRPPTSEDVNLTALRKKQPFRDGVANLKSTPLATFDPGPKRLFFGAVEIA